VKADPTFWILARASGLAAYVFLTSSVLAGLVVKGRPLPKRLRVAAAVDVHRFVALLALGAIALHGVALVLDTTVHVSPAALVVPGLVSYRPVWTALGVLAAELTVLVYVSFSLRRRIGFRAWRRLHWATYALFGLVTVHGLAAGTDSARFLLLYATAVAAVAAAVAWRVLASRPLGGERNAANRDRPVAV
jgi:methionine sulfoxide reductase heme-binding subunit